MVKIVYKEGKEGQNKLSSIEGIEINLINGQKALIYPKYAERRIGEQSASNETEIEALKIEDTDEKTRILLKNGSPAAKWVSQFSSDKYGKFNLSSLLAALEIQQQKKEIDNLAKTIKGADLLKDFISFSWSCSCYNSDNYWCVNEGFADHGRIYYSFLVVPKILYK